MDYVENWKYTIQPTDTLTAITFFAMNIFIPGSGTIANQLMADTLQCQGILAGVLQMLLSVFIVGWVWSVYWGYLIYRLARDNSNKAYARERRHANKAH